MPGGLPGENFILLEFGGEADIEMVDPTAAGAREGVPAANNVPVLDEDEEEDEELEEVGIFVLPLLFVRAKPCSDCAVAYSCLAQFGGPLLG